MNQVGEAKLKVQARAVHTDKKVQITWTTVTTIAILRYTNGTPVHYPLSPREILGKDGMIAGFSPEMSDAVNRHSSNTLQTYTGECAERYQRMLPSKIIHFTALGLVLSREYPALRRRTCPLQLTSAMHTHHWTTEDR
ncbi:hypothetical protein Bbelb_145980 [Branchiostoma belcheri]|nr:hypothetical protein Bbelb_145980 [Branchiostoma belcheri]